MSGRFLPPRGASGTESSIHKQIYRPGNRICHPLADFIILAAEYATQWQIPSTWPQNKPLTGRFRPATEPANRWQISSYLLQNRPLTGRFLPVAPRYATHWQIPSCSRICYSLAVSILLAPESATHWQIPPLRHPLDGFL